MLEVDLARASDQKISLEQQVNLLTPHICCFYYFNAAQLQQVRRTVSRKDELLRSFASEHDEQTPPPLNEDNSSNPDWVHVLTEECRELRESNIQLQDEADLLRKETAEVELKEKELVQQCLEQFSESNNS